MDQKKKSNQSMQSEISVKQKAYELPQNLNYILLCGEDYLPKEVSEDSTLSEEQKKEKQFGQYYYDASKKLEGSRYEDLKRIAKESEDLEREMFPLVTEFGECFESLDNEKKERLYPIAQYVSSIYNEQDAWKMLIQREASKEKPKDKDENAAFQEAILRIAEKSVYIKNQHAISLRMITSYIKGFSERSFVENPAQTEHIISAVSSALVDVGNLENAKLEGEQIDECMQRADVVKALLLAGSAKHEFRSEKSSDRVKEIRRKMVDESVERLNQASKAEKQQYEDKLSSLGEKFDNITKHDENNAFAMFWIPSSMVKNEGEEEKDRVLVKDEQLAGMDEASINLFMLSSLIDKIKTEYKGSASEELASCFETAVFQFSQVMYKYSCDAQVESDMIIEDKTLSEEDRKNKLFEVRDKMVDFSKYHGQICSRMTETLTLYSNKFKGDPASEAEKVKFRMLMDSVKAVSVINPGTEKLLKDNSGISVSSERCFQALKAMDDIQRLAFGSFLIKPPIFDEDKKILTGDSGLTDGADYEESFSRRIRLIKMMDGSNVLSAKDITDRSDTQEKKQTKDNEQIQDTKESVSEQILVSQQQEEEQVLEEQVSFMNQLRGNMEKHIPEKEIRKVSSYMVDGQKREGIGKCRAWWVRIGHVSGGRLKKAVDTHVDRMLQSENLTDRDLSEAATNLGLSTEITSDEVFKKLKGRENTDIYKKLDMFKRISALSKGADILKEYGEIKGSLGMQELGNELSLDDTYFTKYPQALKVVLMYKLVKNVGVADKKLSEINDRVQAAASGLEKMYQTIIGSEDYRNSFDKQTEKRTKAEKNPLSEMMYKDGRALAVDTMDSVFGWLGYIDHHRNISVEGSLKRLKYSQEAKSRLEKLEADKQADKEAAARATLDKQRELINRNLSRSLAMVSEQDRRDRFSELTRKPQEIEPYEKKVGAGAVSELMHNMLKDTLLPRFEAAGLPDMFETDMDMLKGQIIRNAVLNGYCGVKSEEDIGSLTYEQFTEMVSLASARLSEYPQFIFDVSKKLNEKNAGTEEKLTDEQRNSLLKLMFSDNELKVDDAAAMIEALRDRKKFLEENKAGILFGGRETVNPRLYHDLTKMKVNTDHSEPVIRAVSRQLRMEKADDDIRDACEKAEVDMPKSFYEFAAEIRFKEAKTTDQTPKTEEELRGEYKNYVQNEWYTSVQAKDVEKSKPLEKVKDFLSASGTFVSSETENRFMYYGLMQYGNLLSDAFGTIKDKKQEEIDLLNDTHRKVFEKNLVSKILNGIVDKEVACRIYCESKGIRFGKTLKTQLSRLYFDPDFETKMHTAVDQIKDRKAATFDLAVKRRDERIKALKGSGNAIILPLLLENDIFTDHLAADNEEEYKAFSDKFLAQSKKVVEEIEKHPYGEQYLIGKRSEILNFIFDERYAQADVKTHLNLEAYDILMESTVLDSSGHTLGNKISEAISRRKVSDEKKDENTVKLEEGNLYTMALLYDGVGAVLDDVKMQKYRTRTDANTAALDAAIEKEFAYYTEKGMNFSESRRDAIKKSIHQNERKNIFLVTEKEYAKKVKKQVSHWFHENEKQARADSEIKTRREEITENLKLVLINKKKGRLAFKQFHTETDMLREKSVSDYKKRRESEKKPGETDTWFEGKLGALEKDIRGNLEKFFTEEKDNLPQNGALNSFYNETLARMSYHVTLDDPEAAGFELNKDYLQFLKIKKFYEVAGKFLSNKETTKDLPETQRESIIGGLMTYYGESLTDPAYVVTPDVINEELELLLDEKSVGREILNLLEHDSGGYYGIGSDGYNYGDTPLSSLDRREFDDQLKEKAKGGKLKEVFERYSGLDNEVKILTAHILVRDADLYSPGNYLVKKLFNKQVQSYSRTDAILSYIKGETLAEPDYKQALNALTDGDSISYDRFYAAVSLAIDINESKYRDGFAVDKKTYDKMVEECFFETANTIVSEEACEIGAVEAKSIADAVTDNLSKEKNLTNSEKMWAYYTSLRTYEKEIKAYADVHKGIMEKIEKDKTEALEKETDEDKRKEISENAEKKKDHYKALKKVCEDYDRLTSYAYLVSQEREINAKIADGENGKDNLVSAYKNRVERAKIENMMLRELGMSGQIMDNQDELYRGEARSTAYERALEKNTEQARDMFSQYLDTQAFRVDGFKTKSSFKPFDKDEDSFPPNVKEAVLQIDRWVAKNGCSFSAGNSESRFAGDILGHPMRERLFVYYMVEKQRLGEPTGTDVAMSVNGYVPDLDKFKEAIEAPIYKVHLYAASAIKDTDFVKESDLLRGALSTYGKLNTDMIESAIRLLDDDELQVSEQLLDMKESLNTDYSDKLAAKRTKQKEEDEDESYHALKDYLEARRDRQEKLKALLSEIEKLRTLSAISDDAIINKKEKTAAAVLQSRVVRDHMTMLHAADDELRGMLNKADPSLYELITSTIGRRLPVVEEKEPETTGEKAVARAETADDIVNKLSTVEEKLFDSGVFATLSGVTALAKVVSACYLAHEQDPQTMNQKSEAALAILDTIENAAEPVGELIKEVLGSTSEIFGTAASVVAAAANTTAGVITAYTANENLKTVQKAQKKTSKQTKAELKEAEKSGDQKKVKKAKELSRAAYNVGKMQGNTFETRKTQGKLKAAGGAVALATALIPGLNVVGGIVGGVISGVTFLHKIYKEGQNKDDALDSFLGMNELLKEFNKHKAVLKYDVKDDAEAKKLIRSRMLRKFHFSTADQFFGDLAMKYARILYREIFFDKDGKQILGGNAEAIKAKEQFTMLFPDLEFGWPMKAGDPPYPSVDEMGASLMKVS